MKTIPALSALALAAVLAGGIGSASGAFAQDGPTTTGSTVAAGPTGATQAPTRTSVERQNGVVIEAFGEHAGTPVAVYLYENSTYGSSVQVVLDAEQDLIGSLEQPQPFIVGGAVDVALDVQGHDVVLTGTVTESGESARTVDPRQDAGEQIVTRGTRTPLLADLSLTVGGSAVPLEAAPAFAFDLEVRRVTLYGR